MVPKEAEVTTVDASEFSGPALSFLIIKTAFKGKLNEKIR